MGANMRLISGFGCFVCGSLAVLLCAAPANPDRHVNAALARMDAIAALAHSDAALAGPELRTALADPNTRAAVADPVIKVPLAEPEVNVSPLEASDGCVVSEECIDQYLWSVVRTRAEGRYHQSAGTDQDDSQEERQEPHCHENCYQARG